MRPQATIIFAPDLCSTRPGQEKRWDQNSHIVDLRSPWQSHSRGYQVPWATYMSGESAAKLLYLERPSHPEWVRRGRTPAMMAGSEKEFEAYSPARSIANSRAASSSLGLASRPDWDASFPYQHTVDRNPVNNGIRIGLDNRTGYLCSNGSSSRRWVER